MISSVGFHSPFLTVLSKLLHHLSLHCLPFRPGMPVEHFAQLCGPSFSTQSIRSLSSSDVQAPFTRPGFKIFVHLCKHWIGDLPVTISAISFHLFPPYRSWPFLRASSSSAVHFPWRTSLVELLSILSSNG